MKTLKVPWLSESALIFYLKALERLEYLPSYYTVTLLNNYTSFKREIGEFLLYLDAVIWYDPYSFKGTQFPLK